MTISENDLSFRQTRELTPQWAVEVNGKEVAIVTLARSGLVEVDPCGSHECYAITNEGREWMTRRRVEESASKTIQAYAGLVEKLNKVIETLTKR